MTDKYENIAEIILLKGCDDPKTIYPNSDNETAQEVLSKIAKLNKACLSEEEKNCLMIRVKDRDKC